jgi:Ca2+-transporting ATPase
MGIAGTDVSKEAANMVLADDSFGTIVLAIMEGRTIYANMKKFIFYIFSANIGELLAVFSTMLIGLPAPLTAVFILVINTLTDVFPSLALGVEPMEANIINHKPRKPDSKIMEWKFIERYLTAGLWIGGFTAAIFLWNLVENGWHFGESLDMDSALYVQSATMAFVTLTLFQMAHSFNSRSETVSIFKMRFFENMYLIAAVFVSTAATVAFVQMPFFQKYLKTSPLTLSQWGAVTGVALSIILFEEVRKIFRRRAL